MHDVGHSSWTGGYSSTISSSPDSHSPSAFRGRDREEALGGQGTSWGWHTSLPLPPLSSLINYTSPQANRSINDVDEKISKAVQKRQEIVSSFVSKTQENLEAKMEESQEKREAYLNGLKTKLKDHVSFNSLYLGSSVTHLVSLILIYLIAGARWKSKAHQRNTVARYSSTNWRQIEVGRWETRRDPETTTGETSPSRNDWLEGEEMCFVTNEIVWISRKNTSSQSNKPVRRKPRRWKNKFVSVCNRQPTNEMLLRKRCRKNSKNRYATWFCLVFTTSSKLTHLLFLILVFQERRGEMARQKKENRLSGGGCTEAVVVEETASSG